MSISPRSETRWLQRLIRLKYYKPNSLNINLSKTLLHISAISCIFDTIFSTSNCVMWYVFHCKKLFLYLFVQICFILMICPLTSYIASCIMCDQPIYCSNLENGQHINKLDKKYFRLLAGSLQGMPT